jgi:hypothetical protein
MVDPLFMIQVSRDGAIHAMVRENIDLYDKDGNYVRSEPRTREAAPEEVKALCDIATLKANRDMQAALQPALEEVDRTHTQLADAISATDAIALQLEEAEAEKARLVAEFASEKAQLVAEFEAEKARLVEGVDPSRSPTP